MAIVYRMVYLPDVPFGEASQEQRQNPLKYGGYSVTVTMPSELSPEEAVQQMKALYPNHYHYAGRKVDESSLQGFADSLRMLYTPNGAEVVEDYPSKWWAWYSDYPLPEEVKQIENEVRIFRESPPCPVSPSFLAEQVEIRIRQQVFRPVFTVSNVETELMKEFATWLEKCRSGERDTPTNWWKVWTDELYAPEDIEKIEGEEWSKVFPNPGVFSAYDLSRKVREAIALRLERRNS